MISSNRTDEDFAATRWSLVQSLDASEEATPRSRLNELCLRYWVPIQQQIQNRGHAEPEANRLTGLFFEYLQREALERVERHSRFRSFLQAELVAFLDSRGLVDESRSKTEPGDEDNLKRSFAWQVISHAMGRLQAEAAEADRLPMYEALKRYLSVEVHAHDVQREAQALGMRPLFVTMAIRRLRQRFRRLVDDELSRLVADNEELASEREAMFAALDRSE